MTSKVKLAATAVAVATLAITAIVATRGPSSVHFAGGASPTPVDAHSGPLAKATPHEGTAPLASSRALLLAGPDPRSGRPFAAASEASAAAGGTYVPDCPGTSDYYLQPNGAVVALFQGSDAELWAYPPAGPFISGPIPSNSVVTPQRIVVQGQPGYGYETKPGIAQISATHAEGVLVRSYLTWKKDGSSLQFESPRVLSLSQLLDAANHCT